MAIAELNEATTKEEINEYVEQVTKEVEAERAGGDTDKGDAQITSAHADNEHKTKESPAEELSGSEGEAAEVKTKVDDVGEDTGDESWLDDDLKAEVAAYGLDESAFADFASREEVERALRFFDRSALEAGRKALAEAEGEGEGEAPSRNEKGQFAKVEKDEPPKADPPQKREGQYEVTLDTDIYDEEVVGEFTRMRDHYDSRLSELEASVAEAKGYFEDQSATIMEQRIDSAIDALNMPKLFGKTGSESQQELERRQDLTVQATAQQLGLKKLTGRDVDLDALVARVAPMVFADEFDKQKIKSRTRKISKQSNGRQGGGATRPQDPREDPRDEADRLYRELEGR